MQLPFPRKRRFKCGVKPSSAASPPGARSSQARPTPPTIPRSRPSAARELDAAADWLAHLAAGRIVVK